MKLLERPLLETKAGSTPAEFANFLRARGRVFWSEHEGFWVVTDHALVEAVLKGADFSADRSSFFVSRMPNLQPGLVSDFLGVVEKMMVASDHPPSMPPVES